VGDDSRETDRRRWVRERYASIATDGAAGCCEPTETDCCEGGDDSRAERAEQLGYDARSIASVADGANLGLGCGNPTAIADLEPGETVLDLGSGAGFDCFLAAEAVGPSGRVVGVDMTPEMVERARGSAADMDAANVEFRLGEIEHLPIQDASVDAIISNCVINLSPDKPRVFEEAFRVLRPGGRIAISDVALTAEPPSDLGTDPASTAACVGGAASIPAIEAMVTDAGFEAVAVEPDEGSEAVIREWDDDRDLSDFLASVTIDGRKPTS
jgi:SAM-dependent methyltransferase